MGFIKNANKDIAIVIQTNAACYFVLVCVCVFGLYNGCGGYSILEGAAMRLVYHITSLFVMFPIWFRGRARFSLSPYSLPC